MQVTTTSFTVAEYCEQLKDNAIVVNRDYQRTDEVWPPAARSYLIDTILLGYPIPKLSLYQKTDLKSRKTIKEIVDGQQRSKAILDFYEGNLRIAGRSRYSGKKYADLDEPEQQGFMSYALCADVFTATDEADIRQTFRRMNSYTVPLNPEEQRHATHQGAFKWFVVEMTEEYTAALKRLGVFTERNISRMQDARFFTEMVLAMDKGIQTYSKKKLDDYYSDHDKDFAEGPEMQEHFEVAFDRILAWEEIHNGLLMKPFNAYALMLAVLYCEERAPCLEGAAGFEPSGLGPDDVVATNLGVLAEALAEEPLEEEEEEEEEEVEEDEEEEVGKYAEFVEACSGGTNTKEHRKLRFQWFCKALQPQLI